MQRNYLSVNNPKIDSVNHSDTSPRYKQYSHLNEENKKLLSNYMDPVGQYKNFKISRYSNSPILSNSGTYTLQKEKFFNQSLIKNLVKLNTNISSLTKQRVPKN